MKKAMKLEGRRATNGNGRQSAVTQCNSRSRNVRNKVSSSGVERMAPDRSFVMRVLVPVEEDAVGVTGGGGGTAEPVELARGRGGGGGVTGVGVGFTAPVDEEVVDPTHKSTTQRTTSR